MASGDLRPRRLAPGLRVSPVGISCGTARWTRTAVPLDDGWLLDGLRSAVTAGVRLIDTADNHLCGHAETHWQSAA
jgi:aryl-alcohol dehydrogenase-like predicted oxidoreductase